MNGAEAADREGLKQLEDGNPQEGIASFQRAIALNPSAARYRVHLGVALMRCGLLDKSANAFHDALTRAPELRNAFRGLIQMLGQLTWRDAKAGAARPLPLMEDGADRRRISAVVCSIDAVKQRQIREQYERLLDRHCAEIIVIPDAKSLCEAFNRGFVQTTGDIVIFSHDDIDILSPDLAPRLLRNLTDHDFVGAAGTSKLVSPGWIRVGFPHIHGSVVHRPPRSERFLFECYGPPPGARVIQSVDGMFMAARREVCEAIPFDEATFDGFHLYDVDFSFRAYKAGFRLGIGWDILIVHHSGGSFDSAWKRYAERFRRKHDMHTDVEDPARWSGVYFGTEAEIRDFHRRLNETLPA